MRFETVTDKEMAKALFVLFLLLYAFTIDANVTWNDGSRFAAVQSLVEEGTWSIENSQFFDRTGDKAFVNGHFYSTKPPGMTLLGAAFYKILYESGITFAAREALAVRLLILPFAVFSALAPAVFFLVSRNYTKDLRARLAVSLALGAGTGLFVYSGVFIGHAAAATLILLAFYYSLRKGSPVLCGLFGGLALTFEYASLFLFGGVLLNALVTTKRLPLKHAVAALPFFLLILAYNASITGSPFDSPYYHNYAWEGSIFEQGENEPRLERVSAARLSSMFFFGEVPRAEGAYYRGLFLYSPFLLFGLAYARKRDWPLLSGVAALVLFHLTVAEVTGGCVFSNRLLVSSVPFLALPALRFAESKLHAFSALALVSIAINLLGASMYPFTCAHVPLAEAASMFDPNAVLLTLTLLMSVGLVLLNTKHWNRLVKAYEKLL